jgi:polysaccharide biosynthesis/export protein
MATSTLSLKFKDESMDRRPRKGTTIVRAIIVLAAIVPIGCRSGVQSETTIPLSPPNVPRELAKTSLPDYVIEPPDVLLIDAISLISIGPHRVGPLDVLTIDVTPTFPGRPISGPYQVDGRGAINLGAPYGIVAVAGLDIDAATQAVQKHLQRTLDKPIVSLSLAQSASGQQISGEHLVGPDGTVTIGSYGRVFVTGLTVDQARGRIEEFLRRSALEVKLSVDVAGYNSKVYYVITEGAGFGDGVARFPVTGNETVLDAIAQINGISQVSSKQVWIARPAPDHVGCDQILPVDWVAITKGGATQTNYQVMPGDRIFIAENQLVATDTALAKFLAPIERVLGVTLLGAQAANTVAGRATTGF